MFGTFSDICIWLFEIEIAFKISPQKVSVIADAKTAEMAEMIAENIKRIIKKKPHVIVMTCKRLVGIDTIDKFFILVWLGGRKHLKKN